MAVLASDTFTGTNGAAWSSTWTTGLTPTGGSTQIQGNAGRFTTGSNAGTYQGSNRIARRVNITAPANAVALFSFTWPTLKRCYPGFWIRSTNTSLDSQGGYAIIVNPDLNNWAIQERASYSGASLPTGTSGDNVAFAFTAGVKYWCRFGAVGSAIKARIWEDGDPEPSTWDKEATDTTYTTGGSGCGFSIGAGATSGGLETIDIDDFLLEDAFPAAAPIEMDSTSALTLGRTGTAFVSKFAASTTNLGFSVSGVASVLRPAAGASALTIAATSTATPTRMVGGASSLSLSTSATGTTTKPVSGSLALVLAATATATRTAVFNAAAALVVGRTATASVLRPSSATAAFTIGSTSTATVTKVVQSVAPLTIASSATAFNNARIDANPTGLTLSASATASVGGQTEALAGLVLASSATASLNRALGSTAPLVLGSAATVDVARTLQGTAPISVGGLAVGTVVHPVDSAATLALSATADMAVQSPETMTADASLVLGATATGAKATTGQGTSPITVSTVGEIQASRPLTATTSVTTVSVSASATVERGANAVSTTTITTGASAWMLKPSGGLIDLVMATTASIASSLVNGGQAGISIHASATATITAPSPIDEGDEFLLSVQRELTHAYILENPSTIILRPRQRQRTDSGGYTLVDEIARAEQIMRVIEMSTYSANGVTRTETGFQRKRDYQLMCEWDAVIEVDDVFFYDDVRWIVRSFMPENGYEIRAIVERIGDSTNG